MNYMYKKKRGHEINIIVETCFYSKIKSIKENGERVMENVNLPSAQISHPRRGVAIERSPAKSKEEGRREKRRGEAE